MAQSHAEHYRLTLVSRLAKALPNVAVVRSATLQKTILSSVDLIVVSLGFFVALDVTQRLRPVELVQEDYLATGIFAALWLLILGIFGTYAPAHARAGSVEYKRAVNATFVTGGMIGIACYLMNYEYPRVLFATWMIIGVTALCLSRLGRRRTMQQFHKRGLLTTPVLLAGEVRHVDEIATVLGREKWLGYQIKGVVTNDHVTSTNSGVPVLGPLHALPSVIESTDAPVVVFAEGSFGSTAEFRRLAWQLEQSHVQMILAPTLTDVSAERLEFRPVAGLPLVDVARPTAMKSLRSLKRTVDVIGSAIALILAGPVLIAAMIAIKLEDGGPIFFRQRRVGLNGKEFDCLKLRSMCTDAEARLAALQAENEGAGVLFKMKDDPRITRTGKFIRRYSIDELPQLWNTLVGDMSLVGPRPALPSEVERYDFDTRRRLHVRPGLTGLWQVSGRSSLSWEDTVRLDLYYVDNWSLVQDAMILLKTAKAVVGSSGAY